MKELSKMDQSLLRDSFSKVEQIRAIIAALGRDGSNSVVSEDPSTSRFKKVSIPTQEAHDLRRWVLKEKARNAIEIGLAYGYSALHICEGLVSGNGADAKHVVIDPWQSIESGFAGCGLKNLGKAGVHDMVEVFEDESQLVLPRLVREGRQFDFAFIDGNHRFDAVFLDLYFLGRLVKKEGIVFLDDYNLPGIRSAAAFFIKNIGWTVEEIGEGEEREWVVLRTPGGEDTRDFTFFVDFQSDGGMQPAE